MTDIWSDDWLDDGFGEFQIMTELLVRRAVREKVRKLQLAESLAEKHKCPIWIAKDESMYPVIFMGARHLQNSINMLERNTGKLRKEYEVALLIANGVFMGGGERYCAERDAEKIFRLIEYLTQSKITLEQEQARRRGEFKEWDHGWII